MTTRCKVVNYALLITGLILLLPLLAMGLSQEVNWGPLDFVVAGALLFSANFAFFKAMAQPRPLAYHTAAGLLLFATLLLVWVNLAVGVIGSEDNPANLLYLGVVIIGIVGTARGRLTPRGMAITAMAMAVTQVLVTLVAIAMELGMPVSTPVELLLINSLYICLFVAAAGLFWHAAQRADYP